MWGPQAPGTSARAAGPGGTHRAWAPGRRRPVRCLLAGSPPLATRAPLQPSRGGGTDSCVAALEGRGCLLPTTGGRTGRDGSCRGRGGSRVRSRSPLQVPGPPPAASAAPASPTPRLRSALCMSSVPGRGRAGLRVRSRPPCGYAARTWPLGSPRLRTACASAYVRQGARSGGSRAGGGGGLSGMTAHVRFRTVKGFTSGNSTLAVFPFPLTHCLILGSRHSWHRGKRFFASGQALRLDRRREGSEEPSGIQPSGPASSLQEKAGCHGMSGVTLS
ncbi:uncharacterized protein LOC116542899 [Sapajus apella]|uniref:Uncharacterized protein LOC116542899 n=1 Tax=Sapajus apella TaxID=9515 RepID=A0A6J3H1C5_SAPAP|nr:uncharacterized protein LOC116542899 [Sapajus apella]